MSIALRASTKEAMAASADAALRWWSARPRRASGARRAQATRAHARAIGHLLGAFDALAVHRGCAATRLSQALAAALQRPVVRGPHGRYFADADMDFVQKKKVDEPDAPVPNMEDDGNMDRDMPAAEDHTGVDMDEDWDDDSDGVDRFAAYGQPPLPVPATISMLQDVPEQLKASRYTLVVFVESSHAPTATTTSFHASDPTGKFLFRTYGDDGVQSDVGELRPGEWVRVVSALRNSDDDAHFSIHSFERVDPHLASTFEGQAWAPPPNSIFPGDVGW